MSNAGGPRAEGLLRANYNMTNTCAWTHSVFFLISPSSLGSLSLTTCNACVANAIDMKRA